MACLPWLKASLRRLPNSQACAGLAYSTRCSIMWHLRCLCAVATRSCTAQVVEQERELVDAASRRGGDLRAAAAAALQHSAEAVQQLARHFEGQARLMHCVGQE